jgi:hypothetical protein
MDTAYYEELAGRLYGLLIGLDDRIGRERAQWLHHVIEVGEYGLALEDIAGTLAQDAIAVTDQGTRRQDGPGRPDEAEGRPRSPCPGGLPADGGREDR